MNNIENLINELPFNIYRTYEHKCSCGHSYQKEHKYVLTIKPLEHYAYNSKPAHRYLVFYKCSDFSCGDNKRYIGRAVGMGQISLYEALTELKGLLENADI